jgi:hypothetical protein
VPRLAALILLASITACASSPGTPAIDLLSFPSCPDSPALRANLRAALNSINPDLTFREVNLESLPPSDPRCRWQSPTILVGGRDLFGMPAPPASSHSCRTYPHGLPTPEAIAQHLRDCKLR